MAAVTPCPDLPYAERLADLADAARRRGQAGCADRLLLLAWIVFDDDMQDRANPVRRRVRTLPPQV